MQSEITFDEARPVLDARCTADAVSAHVITTTLVCGGVEAIRELAAEWSALCGETGDDEPFMRPEWFESFVLSFETPVILLTARRAGKLVAVLPLTESRAFLHGMPLRKLHAIFNLQTQRFDLIHVSDERLRRPLAAALWRAIKAIPRWHALELRLVPADSWLNDVLEEARRDGLPAGVWRMDPAPFVKLPAVPDPDTANAEFDRGLKRHFRQELKRRLKRLNELGNVEFVRFEEYSADLMDRYLILEAKGWKGVEGTAAACDPRRSKLHHEFARRAGERRAVHVYELKLDGETVAISINLKFGKKTVFWKTSFDENYARFSPGNLLIREFLADAMRMGSTELDMLSPAAGYKKVWAHGEREHAAFYVFRNGLYGRSLAIWKFGVMALLRSVKNSVGQKYGNIKNRN